ncbi:MAG: hypothetical protein FE045_04025, partial [Thermoplasmata archaeon]
MKGKKVVALVIVFMLFSVAHLRNDVRSANSVKETSIKIDFTKYSYVAALADINTLKKEIGVREPGRNYNVVIGGYGTGFAPPSEKEWNEMAGKIRIVNTAAIPKVTATSADLSTEPYFPKVGSQGSQGSCAAWAATYYAAGYIQAKDNGWTLAKYGNTDQLLSPAFTYNKANDGTDSGSSMWGNAKVMQTVGVCRWSKMSYDDTDCVSWGNEVAWRDAPMYRVGNIYYLYTPYDDSTINTIKAAILNGIPVTFALDAYSYYNFGSDDVLGSSALESYINHANCIVGFDDSKVDAETGEVGAFKVVNSWGSTWGPDGNGFYWLTYDAFKSGNVCCATYFDDYYTGGQKPKLLAIWNFSSPPDRDAGIELGIGSPSSPLDTRQPWWDGYSAEMHPYPNFMCMDVTEFYDEWSNGTSNFYLYVGDAVSNDGVISLFKVEYYQNYSNGIATRTSQPSPDTPKATPGSVTVDFPYQQAAPSVVYVDDDYNSNTPGWQYDHFSSIQPAINAVEENGTVNVYSGTYYENIVINKTITIIGENKDTTIIDGGSTGNVVTIEANNVNISGFTIKNGGEEGIYVYGVSHCNISDNIICYNGGAGIILDNSSNNSIYGNVVHNNTYDGILLENASYNSIVGNIACHNGVGNNGEGILLMYSEHNTIRRNVAYGNGEDGIILEPYASYNNVSSNHVYGNADCGILVSRNSNYNIIFNNSVHNNTYDGILIELSINNEVYANHIYNNTQEGVYMSSADTNTIKGNRIDSNGGYGIYINSSSGNLIYNNYFDNKNNAWDNGNNAWNTSKTAGVNIIGGAWLGGNYWSDYHGVDTDGDGLGNTLLPYDSNGNIASGDMLPLVNANHAPVANFSWMPANPTTADTIQFTDSSYDP